MRSSFRAIGFAVLLAMTMLLATGCGGGAGSPSRTPEPIEPVMRDQSSPASAAVTYLEWVSYSYLIHNSEPATFTFTPNHSVRIDSYIEENKQQGRGIDQRLQRFVVKETQVAEDRARVTAREDWKYRYFDLAGGEYRSPWYEVSYDSVYYLESTTDDRWIVDVVDAQPRGAVK